MTQQNGNGFNPLDPLGLIDLIFLPITPETTMEVLEIREDTLAMLDNRLGDWKRFNESFLFPDIDVLQKEAEELKPGATSAQFSFFTNLTGELGSLKNHITACEEEFAEVVERIREMPPPDFQ